MSNESLDKRIRSLEKMSLRLKFITEQLSNFIGLREVDGDMKQVEGYWLPAKDTHFASILVGSGTYQAATLSSAMKYVKHKKVAVDVGAHVGLWARPLAEQFDWIHAFEPAALVRACLARNLTTSNVTIYGCALGNKREQGMLKEYGNSGATEVIKGQGGDVRIRALDEFGLRDIGLLKIDVQGDEVFVLQGSEKTLRNCKPVIIVEEVDALQSSRGHNPHAIRNFLGSLGASVFEKVGKDVIMGWR